MAVINVLFSLVIFGFVNCDSLYRPKSAEGEFCAIPFEHNGKTYHDCTNDGDTKLWCKSSADKVIYCTPKPDWGSCDVAPSSLPLSEVNLILNLVNKLRVQEPALRMTKLRWNSELVQRAQFLSNKCTQSGSLNALCSSDNKMGQLSYQTSSYQVQPKKWEEFIKSFSDKSTYDFSTNTCKKDSCIGYKQLVNAKTSDIGCAVTSCNQGTSFTDVYHCEFYPPNYMNVPYEQGSPHCDKCYNLGMDDLYRCDSDLCEICDKPSSDCKSLKNEMASGNECKDLMEDFCAKHESFCSKISILDASSKQLITTNCRKTCKLC